MLKLCKVYYPQQFNSPVIYHHPRFEDDLKSILEKSGIHKKFAEIFRRKLYYIEKKMHRSTESRWFEKLKEKDLYSIKFAMVKNIRIICTFMDAPVRKIIVLLCGFEEKNSNRGKDSYSKNISIALERLKEIEEGFILEGENL
ncbi:MAG TPA: hypothetical protein PK369_08150 [Thermoclostridium sp.]|nr:hypothetical protein [Clostridiaceae bacterium]HOQ76521.1 hypothetical protein [Thermoclostridium sp.]HPU45044.1 hypothetical protein [Thermoclostridium sp.]